MLGSDDFDKFKGHASDVFKELMPDTFWNILLLYYAPSKNFNKQTANKSLKLHTIFQDI